MHEETLADSPAPEVKLVTVANYADLGVSSLLSAPTSRGSEPAL